MEDYTAKGITARGYIADVTDESQVRELVGKIEADLGTVDILVNALDVIPNAPSAEADDCSGSVACVGSAVVGVVPPVVGVTPVVEGMAVPEFWAVVASPAPLQALRRRIRARLRAAVFAIIECFMELSSFNGFLFFAAV